MERGTVMRRAVFLTVLGGIAVLAAPVAKADDFCENWAAYMWEFSNANEQPVDPTWSEVSAMGARLKQKRPHVSGTSNLTRTEALPFPSIPSSIESELDPQTQAKVRGLYDRYVLLWRRIEDRWKDKFRSVESPTSMQRFVAEREDMV